MGNNRNSNTQAFSCVNPICSVYYLKNGYFCTSSPLTDQWDWLNLHQSHPCALCESSHIYVWLHQLSVLKVLLSGPLSFICGNGLDENLCQPTDNHNRQPSSSNLECIGSVGEFSPPPGVNLLPLCSVCCPPTNPTWTLWKLSLHLLMAHDCQLTHMSRCQSHLTSTELQHFQSFTAEKAERNREEKERQGASKAIILNAFSRCQRLPCIIQSLCTVQEREVVKVDAVIVLLNR